MQNHHPHAAADAERLARAEKAVRDSFRVMRTELVSNINAVSSVDVGGDMERLGAVLASCQETLLNRTVGSVRCRLPDRAVAWEVRIYPGDVDE